MGILKIVLTSFEDSPHWDGPKFSTSRWQPRGFSYPELKFLAPFDPDTGKKMVHLEPVVFKEKYERVLDRHAEEITRFLAQRREEGQIVLCCWCNKGRQKGYAHLYCHTVLLGWWLERISGIEVVYADGREPNWFADIERKEAKIW